MSLIDGPGVDKILDLGANGAASSKEGEIILVLGLIDCVDAYEGLLVDGASHNSLVAKDVVIDDKSNLSRKQEERALSLRNGFLR